MATPMKRRVLIFLMSLLLVLVGVPATNIMLAPDRNEINLKEKSFLFNMDFTSRLAGSLLYPLGISISPENVIIGKEGWLYLGDSYNQAVSDGRRRATNADVAMSKKIGEAAKAWNDYLLAKNVKIFRIMVAPDKGSIYPEYMPDWAKPVISNPTDALFLEANEGIFVDLRLPLLAAKETLRDDIYFKTDSHWNELGAAIAFRTFAEQIKDADPELRWPPENAYEVAKNEKIDAQDLAKFLRLEKILSDSRPQTGVSELRVKTARTDYGTKELILKWNGDLTKPLVLKSEGSLNTKKVLWLRDSMGNSLVPWMSATFSEVLEVHLNAVLGPSGNFVRLVDEWKPDYIFITVVERNARSRSFMDLPPAAVINDSLQAIDTAAVDVHDLKRGPSNNEYQINGNDPNIDFALARPASRSNAQLLGIELTCADGSANVPLELFWLEEGMSYFDGAHSVKLSLLTGQGTIDLRTIPSWSPSTAIKRLRVDIDSVNSCVRFKLNNPRFLGK